MAEPVLRMVMPWHSHQPGWSLALRLATARDSLGFGPAGHWEALGCVGEDGVLGCQGSW